MNVLVTGATGLIGNAIVRRLQGRGGRVRALVRDPERAARVLPAGVDLVRGDVTEPDSLPAAMKEVEWLFHAAGMPEQWQPDSSIFDRVNRQGTVNVLRAAQAARVKRVVYTSTMDVFAAPRGGTLVETNIDTEPKPTAYERSKQDAEREAETLRREGLELVYVNPGAVYGPSPVHVGLNSFFLQVLNRKVPALPPGGMPVAYVDGVADAHLAAAERGVPGERYLLADTHVSNTELAREILRVEGAGGRVPPTAPEALMKLLSAASAPLARTFGFTPLIAPGQLSFLLWDARVDASKARRELGFTPTPLAQGVERTVAFLRQEGLVRAVRQ
ncbi:NAD-dependent epimerase/dehydratase family protein [Archangium violaceum]|uniref:NAD-dependent epimerase/dehydratase family protein n=1 Tax=Archangium violaceum TaxID=83451 RepID=UPI00194EB75B|nr:NAD-dependent epimerase/dehydratase family protein [Archangium violaceum]QRO02004.1 NAD-dependent epimerase/dehydratase family protein [Archangium violaceum]